MLTDALLKEEIEIKERKLDVISRLSRIVWAFLILSIETFIIEGTY